MNYPKPLEIATECYYWKPMAALFRSLEMRLYCDSEVVFHSPILDLGCGDGQVVHMLRELGVLGNPFCGVDISPVELRKAKETNAHLNLVQADANYLPFKGGSFSSVLSNGVLCSIPGGAEQPLKEIDRVLEDMGTFVATVPTDKFVDVLILPTVLNKLSPTLSSLYIRKLNARLPHFNAYSPQTWKDRFEDNGLSVIKSETFFSPQVGFIWNILSIQAFRLFGFLKLTRSTYIVGFASNLWKRMFRKIYTEELIQALDSGYIFIVAQKANDHLEIREMSEMKRSK